MLECVARADGVLESQRATREAESLARQLAAQLREMQSHMDASSAAAWMESQRHALDF